MEIKVYNINGSETGRTVALEDSVFGIERVRAVLVNAIAVRALLSQCLNLVTKSAIEIINQVLSREARIIKSASIQLRGGIVALKFVIQLEIKNRGLI